MKKRILAVSLSLAVLLSLPPVSRAKGAEPKTLDLADGGLVVTATGYTQGGAGSETVCTGPYLVRQTDGAPTVNTITVREGASCSMTISGLNISPEKSVPAIWVEEGAALKLTLEGESTLTGGPGRAGVCTAPGATLTVSGEGTLNAVGGATASYQDPAVTGGEGKIISACGGAGIGGSGLSFWVDSAAPPGSQIRMVSSPSFGTVKIEGGTVNATGGRWRAEDRSSSGAGAGIGAGGSSPRKGLAPHPAGTVEITGGTVTACGGDSEASSLSGGGAGIGAGGVSGNQGFPYPSYVTVSIRGGAVTAAGRADGAGIGGGANSEGGTIEISGGNVTAAGGCEIKNGVPHECWGGAGIGGGDNSGVTSISITGGTVVARAGGAAAGIGSGMDGFVGTVDPETGVVTFGTISIGDSADVTAYGGSGSGWTSHMGGAGIGAGHSEYNAAGCGAITVSGAAKVRAYAGANAHAVGTGSNFNGDQDISLTVDDTVTLWAQNQDSTLPALLGGPTSNAGVLRYQSTGSYLVFSGLEESQAAGYLSLPDGESVGLPCAWENGALTVSGAPVAASDPKGTVGSWAALCPVSTPQQPGPGFLNADEHFAYVVGYPDGTVRPDANISRAEAASLFFRLLKPEVREESLTDACAFADVELDKWYGRPIAAMAKLGILKGRALETFAPNAPITRGEFAAVCARFDTNAAEANGSFTDISGHWAEPEINRAASLGWVAGYPDGSFRPNSPITRAEAIAMINRVLRRLPETGSDLLPGMKSWPDNPPGTWYYLAVQEAANSHSFQWKDEIHESWTSLTPDPDWTED